jgi:coenzyme F420-reducing hydrogenase delta subunit
MSGQEPKLVCFFCKFGWGYVEDQLETAASRPLWIPVLCSGKVDVETILRAFHQGAEGVLILGCPDGRCHFQDGNFQLQKRLVLLGKVLDQFGIDQRRVRAEFAFDPDGGSINERCAAMIDHLRRLPPLVRSKKDEPHDL